MKPNIWIFAIEPIETRYTIEWFEYFPKLLGKNLSHKFNIVQLEGVQKHTEVTPGAFLNFSDTNYWKCSQFCNFLDYFNDKKVTPDDHFIFTDAWNPIVLQLKYMNDLLKFNWTIHGLFHAGSWDKEDFLGRLIGDKPWVRHAEKSFFHAIDYNYFATDFHIKMFVDNLLNEDHLDATNIVRSGWPMEYMEDLLSPYKNFPKRNLILFPHRIAPEKQVEIFKDLAKHLLQYEFVVCQEQNLTKDEYHKLLGEAKIVFSANLQETLGISCYEGAIVNAIPMVPDRLSYSEMYFEDFKYPSHWTESFDSYEKHRGDLCNAITRHISWYEDQLARLKDQTQYLTNNFFSAGALLRNLDNV